MFESAIEEVLRFTRPLHSISRTFGGLISPGSSTLFFVNDKGVAITCKHVANLIHDAENINQTFLKFKSDRDRIIKDSKAKVRLKSLELSYQYNMESTVQLKNNFVNCFDRIEQLTCHMHPALDLAILEFKGFTQLHYSGYARFLKNGNAIRQGSFLCRTGFPFPEFSNFRHNPQTDDIEWTDTGIPGSPSFPIDGMVTRFIGSSDGSGIAGIEMSSPGLRGQSGGPLFDRNGIVYGMQYATNHLHLGFDIREKEVFTDGKKNRVSNFPFLHVGACIHVERIKEFLRLHQIDYAEAD